MDKIIEDAEFFDINPIEEVKRLVSQLGTLDATFQRTKAQVGYLLTEIMEKQLWKPEFDSFHNFMLGLESEYHQSYSSLYSYFNTARSLKPVLTQEQFDQIGIGKAQELAKAYKKGELPPAALEVALDPESTIKDVAQAIHETKEESEKDSVYYDFSVRGYATAEEIEVLKSAMEAAWKTEPVTPDEWNESKRVLSAFVKMAMEYLSEHHG